MRTQRVAEVRTCGYCTTRDETNNPVGWEMIALEGPYGEPDDSLTWRDLCPACAARVHAALKGDVVARVREVLRGVCGQDDAVHVRDDVLEALGEES